MLSVQTYDYTHNPSNIGNIESVDVAMLSSRNIASMTQCLLGDINQSNFINNASNDIVTGVSNSVSNKISIGLHHLHIVGGKLHPSGFTQRIDERLSKRIPIKIPIVPQ